MAGIYLMLSGLIFLTDMFYFQEIHIFVSLALFQIFFQSLWVLWLCLPPFFFFSPPISMFFIIIIIFFLYSLYKKGVRIIDKSSQALKKS